MTVFTPNAGAVHDRSDTVPAWPQPLSLPDRGVTLAGPPEITGVGVDLTDEILRGLGQDPYRIQMARFLAATLDVPMRMVVQAQQNDVQTSLEQLPERLAELWCEAKESDAGALARDIILTSMCRIPPCRSPKAGSRAELRGLQSEKTFSPYGACGR